MVKINFRNWITPNFAISKEGESYSLADLEDTEFNELKENWCDDISEKRALLIKRRKEIKDGK